MEKVDCLRVFKWVTTESGDPQLLVSGMLAHKLRGVAIVKDVSGVGLNTKLIIEFKGEGNRQIKIDALQDGRIWKAFGTDADLATRINLSKKKSDSIPEQIEYRRLREKYHVSKAEYSTLSNDQKHPTWKFLKFLRKLESEESWYPNSPTLEWLHSKKMFGLLALIMDRRFRCLNDAWDAAKASRYWRLAGDYEAALNSTDFVNTSAEYDRYALAAALTSRAAVLRYLKRHTDAEVTLRRADKLSRGGQHIRRVWDSLDRT